MEEVLDGYRGPVKIQLCGPWTLAATLELPRTMNVAIADPGAVADLTASLAEGVAITALGGLVAAEGGSATFRKLDAVAVLTGPLLPAPRGDRQIAGAVCVSAAPFMAPSLWTTPGVSAPADEPRNRGSNGQQ